jgi:hypothetical protein
MTAMDIFDSKVRMNRCSINENRARSIFFGGKYQPCNIAGIYIDPRSEVTMNDVTFDGNIADGDIGAIENTGKLHMNKGVVITRNAANKYSALDNSKSGTLNVRARPYIFDNRDKEEGKSVHGEGTLNGWAF